jgi:enoyl-CoA hydratase/carnithine racemase
MPSIDYTLEDHVAVLIMNSGENRFNLPFFDAFNKTLDEIERESEARVLVVKSSHEKIWSNGIDLEWLVPAIEKDPDVQNKFMSGMYGLMKRILAFPMITIAAITGHAFAGGAFLSFAHDFRFMRSDRGWLCLPEVDINMTLGPVFVGLSKRALPMYIFEEMQYTGIRLTAEECVEHHIVKKACHIDNLMAEVLAFAKTLTKDKDLIRRMKLETHQDLIGIIDKTIAAHSG